MALEVIVVEVPMTELKVGESGVITSIKVGFGCGRCEGYGILRRLTDMGLTPGTRVTVVRSAPFNGPIEVLVRDYKLALGRGIAEKIFVEVQR